MRSLVASMCGVLLAGGCGPSERPGAGVDGGGAGAIDAGNAGPFFDADLGRCQQIDLLFVIDNSGSMQQEQANLAANFPGFIAVLEASGLDYRVGVTTTGRDYAYQLATPIGAIAMDQDGGDNGHLLAPSGCGMTRPWIEQADADPAGTFACLAAVGTSGPSDEMPLGALRDALEDRMLDGSNAGFLRPDALLAVVILTDEDDCSYEQPVTLALGQTLCSAQMEPVGAYVGFLDTLTGARQRWATAVIAGA
ncbi:MAG: VWA domain-containing protein, partial [Kofleriaceae bacterium]